MRQLSEKELNRIKILTESSVSFVLLEPTATALKKNIIDATGPVRNYLKRAELHDYDLQKAGAEQHKVLIPTVFIDEGSLISTVASLYRPEAKQKGGDPRIWFSRLPKFANPNDILALVAYNSKIWVINVTQMDVGTLMGSRLLNPLKEFVIEVSVAKDAIANELLAKLKAIAGKGFVRSLVNHDTGVGRTLEKLLGIEMNSRKTPDYKGIELKSFRDLKDNRKGLFAKTPNWELSKFKSRIKILDTFGYWEAGIFRLYTTVRGTGFNAQGVKLKVDYDEEWLLETSNRKDIGDFLVWELKVLKEALAKKHKETFWIACGCERRSGHEYFQYYSAIHTREPMVDQFEMLVEMGAITVDYPIKRSPEGKVTDKGCNFKLRPNAFDLLFPKSLHYDLR